MQKNKIKGHKPEYKTKFKRKNQSKEDKFFEKMISKHSNELYIRELLIDEQVEKMIYGN